MSTPAGDSARFLLPDLDQRTRALMLDELAHDLHDSVGAGLYMGKRLTSIGEAEWPGLVADAFNGGTPDSLAMQILKEGRQSHWEMQIRRNGPVRVAINQVAAARTLAEGTFNRYYCRAVCRRAIEDGVSAVEVFRARESSVPREASEDKIGSHVNPADLLVDLRTDPSVASALGIPAGPNSGISVRLLSIPR